MACEVRYLLLSPGVCGLYFALVVWLGERVSTLLYFVCVVSAGVVGFFAVLLEC